MKAPSTELQSAADPSQVYTVPAHTLGYTRPNWLPSGDEPIEKDPKRDADDENLKRAIEASLEDDADPVGKSKEPRCDAGDANLQRAIDASMEDEEALTGNSTEPRQRDADDVKLRRAFEMSLEDDAATEEQEQRGRGGELKDEASNDT